MNRTQLLERLLELFISIDIHEALLEEIVSMLSASGTERKFLNLLFIRIAYLQEKGLNAILSKEFEQINEEIFSMHLTGRGFNIRILYGFQEDEVPILLHAFYERADSRNTSYESHIPVASDRLREVLTNNESE